LLVLQGCRETPSALRRIVFLKEISYSSACDKGQRKLIKCGLMQRSVLLQSFVYVLGFKVRTGY
jgi:hypothetical protein